MRQITVFACMLALVLCAGYAVAQTAPPPDTLKVDYFGLSNSEAYDNTFRIINPGTAGGGLCASIYVFDPYQEMSECCSCAISPDGLLSLSVNYNLTGNPLTGVVLNYGVVKVVSSAEKGGTCPTYPSSLTPTAGLRSWMTHVQLSSVNEVYFETTTETASQDATLSAAEVKRLQSECYAIQLDGSGKGHCTCSGAPV